MSGAIGGMLLGAGGVLVTKITVGEGGNLKGYDGTNFGAAGVFGSIVNANVYLGVNVTAIFSRLAVFDLQLVVAGIRVQSFFTNLQVEDGNGNIRNFTSASASSFVTASGQSSWQWIDSGSGSGGNVVYADADVGEEHPIVIT